MRRMPFRAAPESSNEAVAIAVAPVDPAVVEPQTQAEPTIAPVLILVSIGGMKRRFALSELDAIVAEPDYAYIYLSDRTKYPSTQYRAADIISWAQTYIHEPVITYQSAMGMSLVRADRIVGFTAANRPGQVIVHLASGTSVQAPGSEESWLADMERVGVLVVRISPELSREIAAQASAAEADTAKHAKVRVRMLRFVNDTYAGGGRVSPGQIYFPAAFVAQTWISAGVAIAAPEGGEVEAAIAKYGFLEAKTRGFRLAN